MGNTIRVLHVIGSMNRGGAETMIMNLYRHIDRKKIQFDFVENTLDKTLFEDEIKELGGIIYKCPRYNVKNHFEYIKWWNNFFNQHSQTYHIVHGHLGSTAAIYLSIAKKYNMKTIAHSHNTWGKLDFVSLMYRLYSYPTRYIADYFFGCSYDAGLCRFGKKIVKQNHFYVLNNAINTSHYLYDLDVRNRLRKDLGINNEILIGHVGRFNEQKNHKFLIDIFYQFNKKEPSSKLLLLGDGNLREDIIEQINYLNLMDKVYLLGVVDNVNDYLQAMDVFLFPSLYEGLSVAVIEAQASGLPCFLSDTIDKKSAITDNVEFISLKDSPNVWVEKILKRLMTHKRINMNNEIVNAGYDINQTAKWLKEFYTEVYDCE